MTSIRLGIQNLYPAFLCFISLLQIEFDSCFENCSLLRFPLDRGHRAELRGARPEGGQDLPGRLRHQEHHVRRGRHPRQGPNSIEKKLN